MLRNNFIRLLSLLFFLVLSACGGGGGGGAETTNENPGGTTPPDTTVPTASLSPAKLASGVDSTTDIIATFDEDMFANTINASSFLLRGNDGDIDATVSFNATTNIATLNPNTTLGLLKTYTSRLTTDITDLSGNPLALTTTTFTTRDGSWNGSAYLLDGASGGDSTNPQIAIAPNGDAVVVYEKLDGTESNIYASHYSVIGGWSSREILDANTDNDAFDPQVEIDADGNALAVWSESVNGITKIHASRYTVNVGWGAAELIDNGNLRLARQPKIAMDAEGNGTVVWPQHDDTNNGVNFSIWKNSYTVATGMWGTAVLVETNSADAISPEIALAPDGASVITWRQFDGAVYNIVVAYTPASGAYSIVAPKINTNMTGGADQQQIIFDSNGNATIVWVQEDNSNFNIYASFFASGGTAWSTALIETTDQSLSLRPKLAVDPFGNVIAVWVQHDSNRYNIWSNRFSFLNKMWGTAVLVESSLADTGIDVNIAASGTNDFMAIWTFENNGGSRDVWSNRQTRFGWGTPEVVEVSPGTTKLPDLGFDSNGNAIAVWLQTNGGRVAVTTRHFN